MNPGENKQLIDLPTWPLESSLVILTGTHSAGKSTLLSGLEQGKLSEFGQDYPFSNKYLDDLGYGLLDSPEGQRFFITVPEAARWLADKTGHPEFLGEQYSLPFQYAIDTLSTYRIGGAIDVSGATMCELVTRGILEYSPAATQPLIVSDRGPLDGVVYSTERINDRDTNVIPDTESDNEFPRAGHFSEWTRQAATLVIVSDEQEVPFEKDVARADDVSLRQRIAQRVLRNYSEIMPADSLVTITGTASERLLRTKLLLSDLHRYQKGIRLPLSEYQQTTLKLK